MSTVAVANAPQEAVSARSWEKIGSAVVLLLYSGVVLFTVRYHEKWADEAQAWLIARDLDLKTIWFHELRYEGSPGLWHTILWIAQHWFHLPYATLGYIGVVFAIAGVAVLVYKAPFPWYIRWPLAFTYVMVYQYAVIARPYTLLAFFSFLAVAFFNDKEHPFRFTILLILLANTSFHGTIIAACLGLGYFLEAYNGRTSLRPALLRPYITCFLLLAAVYVFLFFILKPTPDVGDFAAAGAPGVVRPTFVAKITAITSGAFLDYIAPSAIFVVVAIAWSIRRRKYVTFVLPVVALTLFYGAVHGWAHHHGTVFVAAVTGFWIAWPSETEIGGFSRFDSGYYRLISLMLVALCVVNIWDSAIVIQREYKYPYCGSHDLADYLKAQKVDDKVIFGYLYWMVAVQAYFDHDILANIPTAYYHQGQPFYGVKMDMDEVRRLKPEYVIISATENLDYCLWFASSYLVPEGYQYVHFSDGYMLTKRAVYQRNVYFTFRRVHPTSGQTPQTLNPDK